MGGGYCGGEEEGVGLCISVTYHPGCIQRSPGALENAENLPGNDLGWGSQPFVGFQSPVIEV